MSLHEIDKFGIPDRRHPTKYSLVIDKKKYPPRYVKSIANRYANGQELEPPVFNGGRESNNYLESLGFHIIIGSSAN